MPKKHDADPNERKQPLGGTSVFSREEITGGSRAPHKKSLEEQLGSTKEMVGLGRAAKRDATRREEEAARRKTKDKAANQYRPQPEDELLPSLRPTSPIGDFFYTFGFFAECWILRIWRLLRDFALFVGQLLVWLLGGVFSKIGLFVWSILKDLFAPLVGFFKGIADLFRVSKKRKTGDAKKNVSVSSYLKQGLLNYWRLIKNLLRLFLPLATAAALLLVCSSVLNRRYALAVEVNGMHAGYVENELVVEEAQRILKDRLRLAPSQSADAWVFTPRLSITTADNLSNQTELANQILINSPSEIAEGRGLYLDGELYGVTKEVESFEFFLQGLLEAEKARYPELPDATPSFVRGFEFKEETEIFLAESVESSATLQNRLSVNISEAVFHIASGGETLNNIVEMYSITLEQLIRRNASLTGYGGYYRPDEDTELLIRHPVPLLQVQLSYREGVVEQIPFQVIEQPTDALPIGYKDIVTRGQVGEKLVYYDYVYINGEEEGKREVEGSSTILSTPVDEIVSIGTNMEKQMTQGGFGAYQFPLPEVQYSSRGFIPGVHSGVDLNAPMDTTIYASNAGIVVEATYHYSYGNYIKIAHEDGCFTLYAHCNRLYVGVGAVVASMQPIAALGSTGNSSGPHLHFEVQITDNVRIDPYSAGFVTPPPNMQIGF